MALVDVESLTDSEIRHKLLEFGCSVGPVTATTRKILRKKLKLLLEEGGNSSVGSDETQGILQSSFDGEINGTSKSRRRTPPRSTNRSPKRRSPARSNVSSSQTDNTVGARSSDVAITASSHISNGSKRPTRSFISQDTSTKSTNSPYKGDYDSSRYVPEVTSTVQSHGNSDIITQSSTSRYLNSSLGIGLNDSFRSRFNETNDADFNLSLNQIPSSQTFSSDFVKRLSGSRSTQRSDYRSPVSGFTTKLLDVKESDDEDTGPSPVYAKFSQSSPRGSPITNIKNIKRATATEGWLPFDSPISTILLLIFLLFFVVIGLTYINMHSADTNLSSPSDIIFPVCLNMPSHVPGENCIRDADKDIVLKLFNIMYKVHYDSIINGPCNGKKQEPVLFTDDDVINMIVEHDKTMSVWVVEQHLKNLKVLLEVNPKWKIKPSRQGISIEEPPVSYYCYVLSNLYVAVDWFFKIALSCGLLYLVYMVIRWWMIREARYKEEVYKLVSSIIDIVSSKAQTPDSFIPISHVRDQLILPKNRARMNKLWQDALALLESDSRLRCEVQQVEGEEFLVWRWLASSSNNSSKRKVWQGQAFDTMEGSVNSLPHSPTSCLKIRHMFDAFAEEGDDWVTTVVNAILEKCGEAKILHVVVDKQSREGCVYMKCATPVDAGIAYRALHGSWFDSNLVTVKYIREKRYLERFPESANCVHPLHPSTN